MAYEIVESWSDRVARGCRAQLVCEVLTVPRAHEDEDTDQLVRLVGERLSLKLPRPAGETFAACGWAYARAYLMDHLAHGLPKADRRRSRAQILAILREVDGLMSEGASWYASEHTHQDVTIPHQLLGIEERFGAPIVPNRPFEICVAGVDGEQAFLFYAWDA